MEKKQWSIHAEFIVLFVTLVGGFYLLDGKIERQCARIDKSYDMFIALQKEIQQEANQFHGRVAVIETKMDIKK